MATCAFDECGDEFTPRTHNQRYCCSEHLQRATNKRIMAKYYETKARKQGAVRICETTGCGTLLSRYNESKVCGKCEAEQVQADKKRLMDLIGL